MPKIEYKATLDAIRLTPELEDVMTQAIAHINEPGIGPLKQTVRWQFWARQMYDLGKKDADPHKGFAAFTDKVPADPVRALTMEEKGVVALEMSFGERKGILPEFACRNGRAVDDSLRDHGCCLKCEGTGCDE